tara:strand:- start:847 stop:1176 length:330 start_codon:yes stop_codon:yes gene_type:complete
MYEILFYNWLHIYSYVLDIYKIFEEKMRYKIINTEKEQRQKELNGNTMLYKKTKIEHDSAVNEYEMVVTYFENDIDFGVFKDDIVIKDEELVGFLKTVFFDYMLTNANS